MTDEELDWTSYESSELIKEWSELSDDEQDEQWCSATDEEREILRSELSKKSIRKVSSNDCEDGFTDEPTAGSSPRRIIAEIYRRSSTEPRSRSDEAVRSIYVVVALGTVSGYITVYDSLPIESDLLNYLAFTVTMVAVIYVLTVLNTVGRGPDEPITIADRLHRVSELVFRVFLTVGVVLFVIVYVLK